MQSVREKAETVVVTAAAAAAADGIESGSE
jgi:tellurite resistance protein